MIWKGTHRVPQLTACHKDVSSVNISKVTRDCSWSISPVCETICSRGRRPLQPTPRGLESSIVSLLFNISTAQLLAGCWLNLQMWTPAKHFQFLIEKCYFHFNHAKPETAAVTWLTTESTSGELTTAQHHELSLLNCFLHRLQVTHLTFKLPASRNLQTCYRENWPETSESPFLNPTLEYDQPGWTLTLSHWLFFSTVKSFKREIGS